MHLYEVRNPKSGRNKRNSRQGPPKGQSWTWRTMECLESVAYRALTGNAHKVLSRIEIEHMSHGGVHNGKLIVTHENFKEYGIRLASVSDAIHLCEYLGFVRVERGIFYKGGNEPNTYRLTSLPDQDGKLATNEWKSINAVHIKAFKEQLKAKSVTLAAKRRSKRVAATGNVVVPIRAGM